MKIGDSIYIPHYFGGDKIWEYIITSISDTNWIIAKDDEKDDWIFHSLDIGKEIFLNKEDAQLKLDEINKTLKTIPNDESLEY